MASPPFKDERFDMDTFLQILLFGGLMFVMMRFGCGSHMFGHGSKDKKGSHSGGCCGGGDKKAEASPGNEHSHGSPPEEDTDPVCGKTVSTGNAKTSVHDGLVYFFCSADCRDTFEASPSEYVNREQESASPRLEQHPAANGGHG